MQLTLHATGDIYLIQGFDQQGLKIRDAYYQPSLILSPSKIDPDWPGPSIDQLNAETAQELIALEPEIIILGSGSSIQFPPIEFSGSLLNHGIGLETMDNPAACRTYNVLATEGRAVLLVLLEPISTLKRLLPESLTV